MCGRSRRRPITRVSAPEGVRGGTRRTALAHTQSARETKTLQPGLDTPNQLQKPRLCSVTTLGVLWLTFTWLHSQCFARLSADGYEAGAHYHVTLHSPFHAALGPALPLQKNAGSRPRCGFCGLAGVVRHLWQIGSPSPLPASQVLLSRSCLATDTAASSSQPTSGPWPTEAAAEATGNLSPYASQTLGAKCGDGRQRRSRPGETLTRSAEPHHVAVGPALSLQKSTLHRQNFPQRRCPCQSARSSCCASTCKALVAQSATSSPAVRRGIGVPMLFSGRLQQMSSSLCSCFFRAPSLLLRCAPPGSWPSPGARRQQTAQPACSQRWCPGTRRGTSFRPPAGSRQLRDIRPLVVGGGPSPVRTPDRSCRANKEVGRPGRHHTLRSPSLAALGPALPLQKARLRGDHFFGGRLIPPDVGQIPPPCQSGSEQVEVGVCDPGHGGKFGSNQGHIPAGHCSGGLQPARSLARLGRGCQGTPGKPALSQGDRWTGEGVRARRQQEGVGELMNQQEASQVADLGFKRAHLETLSSCQLSGDSLAVELFQRLPIATQPQDSAASAALGPALPCPQKLHRPWPTS